MISADFKRIVIVPMTLANPDYWDEIIGRLMREGVPIRHFILRASRQTLLKRLGKRLQGGDTWAKAQIDRCIFAFDNLISGEKIETDNRGLESIVDEIAKRSGLSLPQDLRPPWRRKFDQTLTLIKHIR
jgi:hypothetical protein